MRDISLHILDIVQNSIAAQATIVEIEVCEDKIHDTLTISISDNGSGMDRQMIEKILDPFCTTRTTRKVGLGLPLLKAAAERSGGYIHIDSKLGKGTTVKAVFRISHIDRPPLGRLDRTIVSLIVCNPEIEYIYRHITDKGEFVLDTRDIKRKIEGISITQPEVLKFIGEYIEDGIRKIGGGVIS
ncbi:MAG TPA: ATP-binding protein [Clostridiales bacterium]|nr:ATP-binding protein [Clostridiales bacterium]